MNRPPTADAAGALDQLDAASVAQSLRTDFIGLIAIFDRQLSNGIAADGDARSRIFDARVAAERGLDLTRELVELLRVAS